MKFRLLIASFVAALTASFAAVAADAPAKDAAPAEQTEKAPAKKKVKPHSHAEIHKQGVAPRDKAEPAGEAKKPLHEHTKEHKQQ